MRPLFRLELASRALPLRRAIPSTPSSASTPTRRTPSGVPRGIRLVRQLRRCLAEQSGPRLRCSASATRVLAPPWFGVRVNTYTTGLQHDASVALDPSGNFVVVWASLQDGSSYGIFGQRYSTWRAARRGVSGEYVHHERPIPSRGGVGWVRQLLWSSGIVSTRWIRLRHLRTALLQLRRARRRVSGQHVHSVYPESSGRGRGTIRQLRSHLGEHGPGGLNLGVFGQRYASSGSALGPEFHVNTYMPFQQYREKVASAFRRLCRVWVIRCRTAFPRRLRPAFASFRHPAGRGVSGQLVHAGAWDHPDGR